MRKIKRANIDDTEWKPVITKRGQIAIIISVFVFVIGLIMQLQPYRFGLNDSPLPLSFIFAGIAIGAAYLFWKAKN